MASGSVKSSKVIPFNCTFPSAIDDVYVRFQNNWLEPQTGHVHLSFAIHSQGKKIPGRSGVFANVPQIARPTIDKQIGYVIMAELLSTAALSNPITAETFQVDADGDLYVHYYVSGKEYVSVLMCNADYIIT